MAFCLGAIALALVSQALPFNPGVHLIWAMIASGFYLWRIKASGTQIDAKLAAFVAIALIGLSLFTYAAFSRLPII